MNTTAPPTPTEPNGAASPTPAATIGPFDFRVLRRQLLFDSASRWAAALVLGVCLLAAMVTEQWSTWGAGLLMVAVFVVWLQLGTVSARVWRQLHQLTPLLAQAPAQAETHLAGLLRRMPLHRPVRLLLYHRLAMLRHRQQRFAETAAICRALLTYGLGPAERVRAHLLLMLVEACLTENDPFGAHAGLVQLHQTRLNLIESLQRMALQTRYEIAVGYDKLVLDGIKQKIELAELMPAPQCGIVHAMFALAATRCRQSALADWLQRRGELICGSEKLEELARTSRFLDIPDLG